MVPSGRNSPKLTQVLISVLGKLHRPTPFRKLLSQVHSQMPHTTHLLKALKVTLTDANPDYIGSLTLPQALCHTHDLHARQLVHIRVTNSGTELWTYIITTKTKSVCLNGAAALLAKAGDEIVVSAFHHDGWVEVAVGKIHRARVTGMGLDGVLTIDRAWFKKSAMGQGQVVSIVNIRSGRRDTVVVGEGDFGVCDVGVRGYEPGDLVIVMAYAWVTLDDLRNGDIPEMKIYFPDE